jgi:hypothetical protein
MISSTSFPVFSTTTGIGATGVGATQPAPKPHHPHGVQQARGQPRQPAPLQAQPPQPGATPPPGQTLPRGSLLDLSV